MCLTFQPSKLLSSHSLQLKARSSPCLPHFILAIQQRCFKMLLQASLWSPQLICIPPLHASFMALVRYKSFSVYNVITYVYSSSSLQSHELPEYKNKMIHLYINLIQRPILFFLFPFSLNDLMLYNFIYHLHINACSPDLSSTYTCLGDMAVSRFLTLSMFSRNSL